MYKILVTGANGFIGKPLCSCLINLEHELIELTSKDGDIALLKTWELIEPAQIVIHVAARTFVPDSWEKPDLFLESNTLGTLRALEYCKRNNAKMVYISSYLYGNADILPIPETAPVFTPNPYALSKKMAEEYCRLYAASFDVKVIILRPFNIYGNDQNLSFLIPEIINQVLHEKKVHVRDLNPKRDYLFIDDFIHAIIKSLEIETFEFFNIGSGVSYSVKEIIDMVQHICGTNYTVTSSAEKRRAEIMDTIADITKAERLLLWKPMISLQDGLSSMVQHLKKNYI